MSRTIPAIFALMLLVSVACSDGDEESNDVIDSIGLPAETRTVEPNDAEEAAKSSPEVDATTTTASEAAPATTIAAPTTTIIPRTLAFTSSDDVGTFFETQTSTGLLITSAEAGGAAGEEIIEDGTVVKALDLVELNGYSWVLVGTPLERKPIGWVLAEDLIETEQLIVALDVGARGRYHRVAAGSDVLVAHTEPNAESDVTGSYSSGEIVLHSGETALIPDGGSWAKILNPSNLSGLGWVNADFLTLTSGVQVHNADGSPAPTTLGNWDSGARISAPVQKTATCAYVQLEIGTAASGNASSHVLYGSTAPTSPDDGQPEFQQWNMGSDTGLVYIRPGSSVLFTLPAHPAHTYYFMALGIENDAPFVADANGAPILNADGRMVATDFITFTADGTC